MDKVIDTLFDPKVIVAALVGWTLRGLLSQSQSLDASATKRMAGELLHRQANVAAKHAQKRVFDLADERTRAVVDALLPRAPRKDEARIVQLSIPER